MQRTTLYISATIFLVAFFIYTMSPITPQSDSLWEVYVAERLVKTGKPDLDIYRQLISPDDYRIENVNGHLYSVYPLGTPLMAAPIVGVIDIIGSRLFGGMSLSAYLLIHTPNSTLFLVEKMIASILTAINCVIIFALGRYYLNTAKAIILTIIFAFATSAWSVASRGLWQHGPSMLCLSLTVYILIVGQKKPRLVPLAGFPLAFSFLIRPTNVISIGLFTIYVWFAYRKYWIYYILCLAAVFVPFIIYNYSIYSSIFSPYYSPQKLGNSPFLLEALAGNLVSPARGLFIFSPILILSIFGFSRTFRKFRLGQNFINIYLFGAIVLHWIVISLFKDWGGGWSIGPRYFSDMIPYFICFLIPVLDGLSLSRNSLPVIRLGTIGFVIITIFSIFVHYRCSVDYGPTEWNIKPDISITQSRLWDWSDIQFLRGLCPSGGLEAPKCWYETKVYPKPNSMLHVPSPDYSEYLFDMVSISDR